MSEHASLENAASCADLAVPSVEVAELLAELDRGADLLLLDVRNEDEYASWRVEGRRPVDTVHVPYFAFLEDPEASLALVPRGREVVVLCAKGGSSELVAGLLREVGVAARNVAGGMIAYGDHLEAVKVPLALEDAARCEIWQVSRRGKGCLSYVVRAGGEAVVVDPSRRASWYAAFVASLGARIVRVLDTHVHADHVSGGPALAAAAGAAYHVDAGGGLELRHAVAPLRDGERVLLGGAGGVALEVRSLRTPGHTPGSTSFLVADRYLLSGDTLFVASVGRPDLGGHVEAWGRELFESLTERLAVLPDATVVLPAHCRGVAELADDGVVSGTLGGLRRTVPELQLRTAQEFVEAVRGAVKPPPDAYGHIVRLNLGVEAASEERLVEWELGKNQCAVGGSAAAA